MKNKGADQTAPLLLAYRINRFSHDVAHIILKMKKTIALFKVYALFKDFLSIETVSKIKFSNVCLDLGSVG